MLENASPIINTSMEKFPFVSRQLLKMAEGREETGTGTLPTRCCAIIIDEAHSSQGGAIAADLKEVLGGEGLREEAKQRAAEEGLDGMEELFRSMAKRGRQANLSCFAFKAASKHKTLAVFGRGFDASTLDSLSPTGHGLRGISERAHDAGAAIRINSSPGAGTSIDVTLALAGSSFKVRSSKFNDIGQAR